MIKSFGLYFEDSQPKMLEKISKMLGVALRISLKNKSNYDWCFIIVTIFTTYLCTLVRLLHI